MLRFANVCAARREGYRTAGNMARGAYHILKEKCNSSDAFVMRLLHQADVRAVRLMGEGRRDERLLEKQRREMIDLSETISSLEIRRETARELAGYWERYGEPDVAMEQVNVLSTLRPTLSDHQGMDEPTFLRPRIEWFLASPRKQDKQEAGRLIKEEFIPLYRTDRQGYYADVLQRWCNRRDFKELGLSMQELRVPAPTYSSRALLTLPRGW